MRRIRYGIPAIVAGAAMLALAGCSPAGGSTAAPTPSTSVAEPVIESPAATEEIRLGEGRDRRGSLTAEDWATYADHVVVFTVANESRVSPSKKEIERGEGMVGRTVQVTVSKVLWSAPDAPQKAPRSLTMPAPGWVFNNNEDKAGEVKFGISGAPRLEKGHSYIKAIEWTDDPCSSDPNVGTWEGLGAGGTLPYEQGVLGVGEFEGRVQTLDVAKARFKSDHAPLRQQVVGASTESLVAALKAAPVRAEVDPGTRECDMTDR
ncbi:hypothetical protein ACTI_43930 [Actinoplanes sp. OR16]|uniref:hypothetical protein n=1 Tax=Actinoplanes sp. OR16 TaxID=946334 RepID=UPI000F700C6D|nr:hypothetical protein [Actinoplanes sp. OR16]BBH67708.1 hypothetical protein ACTI_43930 [Actinoplanes sp. OR16]